MKYPVTIPGMEGHKVEISTSFWTGNRLLVDDVKAPRGNRRNEMLLTKSDGSTATATWKPQIIGLDVPQLSVDGQMIKAVEPLTWYQVLWSILPVSLVFVGGALGALCGILGFYFNGLVFRSKMNTVLKYIVTAGITFLAAAAYLVLGIWFTSMIQS